jgi:sodium-coupled neutral amino acid transporter 2
MAHRQDLESHLLLDHVDEYGDSEDGIHTLGHFQECDAEDGKPSEGNTRLNHSTAALAATIVGAGIVALPKAFAALGLIFGSIIFMLVYGLSSFSLSAMIRAANFAGCWTYDELTRSQFGGIGARSLDIAIVLNNSGGMIIYLIIMGDVLVGAPPHYDGLITNLFGIHTGDVWWVSRPFVMAVVCIVFLLPLVSLRSLRMLGPMSSIALLVASSLVSAVAILAGTAAFEGQLGDFNWLPNKAILGDTAADMIVSFLSILPIISMSFVCHFNLLPVANSLERFTERRIAMVIRRALIICTVLFATLAISGVVLFGSSTENNILLNLRPEAVEKYISLQAATVLCFSMRLAYFLVLVSSFAMLNWALRETLTKLMFGVRTLEGNGFLIKSYAIVLVQYLVSITFPNIWKVMGLTGATAAVYVSYILPGALILSVRGDGKLDIILGGVCVVLGIIMGIVGVAKTLFLS